MGFSKRVSLWTVEDVHDWVKEQYRSMSPLQPAIIKHAISGRSLLRMSKYQLERIGVERKHQQEILQDVLLLKVQEELENINDIFNECFSA